MSVANWPANPGAGATVDLVNTANKNISLVNIICCNTGATADLVTVTLTDASNTLLATIMSETLQKGQPFVCPAIAIPSSATPQKVRVFSTQGTTSFLASGDAT